MTCINYQPINATLKMDFWHLLHTEMAKKLKFTLLTPNIDIIIGFYEIFYFRTPKGKKIDQVVEFIISESSDVKSI